MLLLKNCGNKSDPIQNFFSRNRNYFPNEKCFLTLPPYECSITTSTKLCRNVSIKLHVASIWVSKLCTGKKLCRYYFDSFRPRNSNVNSPPKRLSLTIYSSKNKNYLTQCTIARSCYRLPFFPKVIFYLTFIIAHRGGPSYPIVPTPSYRRHFPAWILCCDIFRCPQ